MTRSRTIARRRSMEPLSLWCHDDPLRVTITQAGSLADAEGREDMSEHVVGGHLTEDCAQRVEGLAQVEGDDLGGGGGVVARVLERLARYRDGGEVARVEGEGGTLGGSEGEGVEASA